MKLIDPGTEDWVWLVTIETPGAPLRLASRDAHIADATTGTTYIYRPGVASVSAAPAMGDAAEAPPELSIPVTLLDVDGYAALASQGHRLPLARAEVAVWVDGTDWSRRVVVGVGQVQNPEWGIVGEPIRFMVAAKLWEDPSLIPAATARIDGETWPHVETLLPDTLGSVYPIVIGKPGIVSTMVDASGMVSATRGVWAEHNPTYSDSPNCDGIKCIIAGHHVQIGENGTFGGRVYTRDSAGQNEARMRVRNGYDGRGQPIAWIPWWSEWTVSAPDDQFEYDAGTTYQYSPADTDAAATYGIGDDTANNAYVTEDQEVPYLTWLDDIDGGGGLEWRGELLRNACDVIEWVCSFTGQNIDSAAFASLKPALAAYKIDTVIEGSGDNERTSPWEWLKSNVLPMLPITLAIGPRGIYPVLWRWGAGAADATVWLNADIDAQISAEGGIRVETSGIRNRFTAKYARSIATGQYVGEMALGPEPYDPAVPLVHQSAICRLSASLYRHPNGQPYIAEDSIELPCVYDDGTVAAVLESRAQRYALAVELLDLIVPVRTYGPQLDEGAVAAVTYTALGLSNRAAIVLGFDLNADNLTATVRLRLLPDLPTLWSAA